MGYPGRKWLFSLAGVLLLGACSDPEQQARDQYMALCADYRQSCACQYDYLRPRLDDESLAGLMGIMGRLARVRAEAGGTSPTIQFMPGSPSVRQTYFNAVLACTRDAGF